MVEKKTEPPFKNYCSQRFYLTSIALQAQLSNRGAFINIAKRAGEGFNWKESKAVKLSIDELSMLAYALELLRTKGEPAYRKYSEHICGVNKKTGKSYENLQFSHNDGRVGHNNRMGWSLHNDTLSFIIASTRGNINLAYIVQKTQKLRLERFLNFIINEAFIHNKFDDEDEKKLIKQLVAEEEKTELVEIPKFIIDGFSKCNHIDELNDLDEKLRLDGKARYDNIISSHDYDDLYEKYAAPLRKKLPTQL